MGSQISDELVFGGFSYDLAFPFAKNRKMSKEMVLKDLELLSEKGIKTALMVLDSKEYNCFHKAVNIVEKKFLFYKKLLESEELRNKHIDALGADNLALRIFFAMHGCVNHTEKILQAIEEEVKELVPNVNLALDNPNWWTVSNINEPKTPCVKMLRQVSVSANEGRKSRMYKVVYMATRLVFYFLLKNIKKGKRSLEICLWK